ncbi:uncharacterized protein DS421_18g619860 [Arachis hypogaea]|nr:uncharacterized protein DS421_18g619860 [Arachis hypogaea]
MREEGSSWGRKKTPPVLPAPSCLISTVAVEGPSPWPWRGAAVHACRHQKRSRCRRRLSLENTPYRRASGRQNHGPERRGLPLLLLLLRSFILLFAIGVEHRKEINSAVVADK